MLFDILSNNDIKHIIINDINFSLINTYKVIQKDCSLLIQLLQSYQSEFDESWDKKALYYDKRAKYNEILPSQDYSPELAALFIFIMKTCFNGLYRVNSKGFLNTPSGDKQKISLVDEDNFIQISKALQKAVITCGSYEMTPITIIPNTFIYMDPPYRPLNITSFTKYSKEGFDDSDQVRLCNYTKELSKRGAYVLLSNSDPKNHDPSDSFFDDLYSDFTINRINAKRMINRDGRNRGGVTEILVQSSQASNAI